MPPPYKNATCRGSYLLRTACGKCEKCADERAKLGPSFDSLMSSQSNLDKLRSCQRHLFGGDTLKLGERPTCKNCGGQMQITDIGQYIAGYEAHGGTADDIWPGYHATKRTI